MKKSLLILAVVVAAFVVPIIVTQATRSEGRALTGVSLSETRHTEIAFRNDRQDIDLAGMLFVPRGDGPFAAVVVIHGSGTSVRDNRWYLTLARYLQEHDIVVLLPDKRGSEKSGGSWRGASFDDLATDTLAAVEYLLHQHDVPLGAIGIVGMSQGGWIAPLVASQSRDVSFVVSVVGSAVTPEEQLLFEEDHNLRQFGILPGLSYLVALMSTTYIEEVAQKDFWDAVGDFDPLPYWKELDIDVLALFGEDDTNVPSAESARRLRALGNPRIDIRVYEDSGHALESPPGKGDSIFRADALEDIRRFVESVAERVDQ